MTRITRATVAAGAVLIAAVAITFDSAPTLAQDQSAPCSWGSNNVCYHERYCTSHGFTFQLWPFQIGWTTCLDWAERTLFYKDAPTEVDTSSGNTPEDPGAPPGGD